MKAKIYSSDNLSKTTNTYVVEGILIILMYIGGIVGLIIGICNLIFVC